MRVNHLTKHDKKRGQLVEIVKRYFTRVKEASGVQAAGDLYNQVHMGSIEFCIFLRSLPFVTWSTEKGKFCFKENLENGT